MVQERLSMRKIREVLRLKEEAGLSNRAISRACKISNSTVGEYLQRAQQAGLSWPLPEGLDEDELYQKLFPEDTSAKEPDRPLPDWKEMQQELKKKGVTLKLLWIEYKEKHADGYKYSQFCELFRRWAKVQSPTGRFPHHGGEVMEVDYAGMTVTIVNPETGETHQAPVFVATLPASNYIYAEVQPSQELVHWINGHVRAVAFFGGVTKIFRPDNTRTGIKSPNYYEPDLNPTYQEMAEYYQVAVLPARVRRPKDKPAVENGVQNVERWVLAPLRKQTFFSEGAANRAIRPLLEALNQRVMAHLGKSRRQLFEEVDQPELRPIPAQAFTFATWKKATVNIDYHVPFDQHLYSVPHILVHQEVDIKATERMIQIFHKGKEIALHARIYTGERFSTHAEHMPSNHRFVLEVDADWLLKQAQAIGPQTTQYLTALLRSRPFPEQAYRSCLGVLSLARKYPARQVEKACQGLQESHLLSYKDLKSELEVQTAHASNDKNDHPITPSPAHENIRGKTYYH